jgi:hypothetical protein
MTAQELVNRHLYPMLLFAVCGCLMAIGFIKCFVKDEPKPQHQTPICTVLYLDRNAEGLVVYANNQWECKLK